MNNNNISIFLDTIVSRGFIHQTTDLNLLRKSYSKIIGYTGFDCTADTLHVGSLLQLMLLRWLQKTGNKPIVLIGGGTTKIGDPSGKDATRKILDQTLINKNANGLKNIIKNFIDFNDTNNGAILVDNSSWLDNLNYIDFLRNFGCHFSVNRMLTFDSVKTRLDREQNLSFLEFNYMITQAYDFYILNQKFNCNVQFGGSDQWGNIINGIDLIKKTSSNNLAKSVHAITSPLITTANGNKMGKTANGAIWLSENHLPVFDFWQFWRNTADDDVCKFLKLFTEIDLSEIKKYENIRGEEINEIKIILANEVTKITHGKIKSNEAHKASKEILEKGWSNDGIPNAEIERKLLSLGVPAFQIFSYKNILCKSNSEARRLIKQGGAKINGEKIKDFNTIINDSYLKNENCLYISAGTKRHALIKAID